MTRNLVFALVLAGTLGLASRAQSPASTTSGSQAAVRLTVSVTGIRDSKGQIFVQLWNTPTGFPKQANKALHYVVIPATQAVAGTATANFEGVSPGVYAVSVLHDENNNGKMDSNFLGIPQEGWAVSNNVITHTHPPSFEQASFPVPADEKAIAIAIHY